MLRTDGVDPLLDLSFGKATQVTKYIHESIAIIKGKQCLHFVYCKSSFLRLGWRLSNLFLKASKFSLYYTCYEPNIFK